MGPAMSFFSLELWNANGSRNFPFLVAGWWMGNITGRKGSTLNYQGTIGCTPNSVPMVLIGLI